MRTTGLLLLAAATVQVAFLHASSSITREEKEALLAGGTIVGRGAPPSVKSRSWRVSLDDGQRRHDASVEASMARESSERDHRFNVAAYELDKLIELNLVAPSVERTVNGQPASVTWWVDDVLMSEVERRRQGIEPPNRQRWEALFQAVRVFDELIANAYRDMNPASYASTVWDNLLITREWRIALIDHTRSFATTRQLAHPESLVRCDRTVLTRLRELNADILTRRLGRLLTSERLEALEIRRVLILKHFDAEIGRKGAGDVLYDRQP